MKAAIVGCGFIASVHAQAIRSMGHQIEVAVDADPQILERFCSRWEIGSHSDNFLQALGPEIDVVHICTPPTTHFEMTREALKAGKHVICEKPLCLDPDQAKELYELAERMGKIHATNFNVRYHDACGRARQIVSKPEFGNVCLIHGVYLQEFHVLPADYMWRYIPELAGAMRATTEIGSHVIDLMRFWTGLEITAVSATYAAFTPERYLKDGVMFRDPAPGAKPLRIESDDAAMVAMRFSNGAVGHMLLSEVSHGRSNYVNLEVSGTEQSVWWNSETPYDLHTSSKFSGVLNRVNAFGGGFPDTFQSLFADIYAAINGKETMYPTFYDGYVNSLVCDTIYRSAHQEGKWLEVAI
jgi:predicted dehydrogenase